MVIYNKTGTVDHPFIIKAINEKLSYNVRIKRLQDYYKGAQDILLRDYDDPTKPNNKIPVNYCKDIADFLTAYLVGVPIEYDAPQIVLDLLNYNDNDEITQNIALSMNVAGMGAELFYIDSDGIPRFNRIDPTEAIFVYDDALRGNLTHFIRLFPKDDKAEGYYVTVYDNVAYQEYELTLAVSDLAPIGGAVNHYFGDVPAILYLNNDEQQGSYEQIIHLQNALNKILSDEVNSFESFVDAYLVLEGMQATQTEDIEQMKVNRVLLTDAQSKAYWLVKDVNNEHIKQLKNDILDYIRELGKLPDIKDIGGLGTSGEAIRMKLIKTEIQAAKQERVLTKGIQRKMELLYNVLKLTDPSIGQYTDVVPTFARNFLIESEADSIKEQINYISTMLSDEYIDREKALELNPLIEPEEIPALLRRLDLADFGIANDTYPLGGEGA